MWKKFKTTTNPVISLPPISIRSSLADKVEQNHSNREIQSPTKNVKLNDGLFLRREDQIRKPIQNQKLQQEKAENLPDIFTMPQGPDTLLRQNQKKSRWYNDRQRDMGNSSWTVHLQQKEFKQMVMTWRRSQWKSLLQLPLAWYEMHYKQQTNIHFSLGLVLVTLNCDNVFWNVSVYIRMRHGFH